MNRLAMTILALAGAFLLPVAAQARASCEQMASAALPAAAQVSAVTIPADRLQLPPGSVPPSPGMSLTGALPTPGHGSFCRVSMVLRPTPSSNIRTEIWLPLENWNGKFIGVGNFGWGGELPYSNMLAGLQKGYAVAGNDTGHDSAASGGHGGKFLMGNSEALVDYAYRANHEMTVAAKSIISGFYGSGPARSYWIGCSLGGLQGLIEAKRYPEDYDGIVAGAPPNPLTLFNAAQLWPNWLLHRSPAMALPPEKYRLLHAAILKDCASVAGQALGYVDDPSRCAYDPARLACRKGDNPGCLTRAQVAFVRLVWRGPVNSRTGKLIFPGPAKGSELEWGPFVNGKEFVNALDLYRYAAFQQPQWSSLSMNWARDVEAAANKIAPLMHVDDDLTAFTGRGGRLLLYVGWNDYHNPLELAGYMSRIHARIGEKAQHYVRMFAIPGINHCASGAGCDSWDKIDAIDAWVDRKQGLQPRSAVRYEQGRVVRTQPLCYWPQMPVYDGIGPKEDQSSYACRAIGAETGDPHE